MKLFETFLIVAKNNSSNFLAEFHKITLSSYLDNINSLYMWTCTKCDKLDTSRLGDVRLEFKMANMFDLYTRNPLALKECIECRYFTEMLQPGNECITVDIFYEISYERLVTVRQIRWPVRMHYRPRNWS